MSDAQETAAPVAELGVGPAEFAHRLLSRGELAVVRGPLRRAKTKGTPARIAAIRDMAVRATVGWLARQGGWQTRAVVAGGRRREGRLWASGIWDGLALSFSAASLELLVRTAAASAPPGAASAPPGADAASAPTDAPSLARLVRAFEGIPVAATTGDLVLYHLVLEPVLDAAAAGELADRTGETPSEGQPVSRPATPTPPPRPTPAPPARQARPTGRPAPTSGPSAAPPAPERPPEKAEKREPAAPDAASEAARARTLIALSPLTGLLRAEEVEFPVAAADDSAARAAFGRRFEPLVRGDRAVLMTYLDDAIAKRWLSREPQRRASFGAQGARRYAALAAALEGLAQAATAAGRPDALRPIARFFERYVLRFGQREAVSRDLRERVHASVPLASERAALLGRVARLFEASRVLEREAERVLDTPFVDRSEEDKVYVADYQDRVRDLRPELEAIRRELSGEVG